MPSKWSDFYYASHLDNSDWCCISIFSYIKPQPRLGGCCPRLRCISIFSYIKPQLRIGNGEVVLRCISIFSYIKPQLANGEKPTEARCISIFSYIKPQHIHINSQWAAAVYLSFPTSNHNRAVGCKIFVRLYIYLFLHQTTTLAPIPMNPCRLYIYLFLHQTTTQAAQTNRRKTLYIYLFLSRRRSFLETAVHEQHKYRAN